MFNLKEIENTRKLPLDFYLDKSVIDSLKNFHYFAVKKSSDLGKISTAGLTENRKNDLFHQRKSLAEKGRIAYWLSLSLKKALNQSVGPRPWPKIYSVENEGKINFRLELKPKLLGFNKETLSSLADILFPEKKEPCKAKEFEKLLLEEKRVIVLKI